MWVIAWTCWAVSLLGLGALAEKSPRVIAVKTGADVVLQCDTNSNGKSFELLNWNLNNSKTPFFAKFMEMKPFIGSRFSRRLHAFNDSAILLSHVTPKDSGTYRCKTMLSSSGANAGAMLYGTPIKLTVEVIRPFFIKQPPKKVSYEINSARPQPIDCVVHGIPKPIVEWYRLGGPISRKRTNVSPDGTLTFTSVEMSDAGRYVCSASNDYGSVSHEFVINVTRTTQPLPSNRVTVEEGKTKVLHCLLDSSAPAANLHYSWTKDGKDVMSPSQSRFSIIVDGSLYIKNTKRMDSGVYRCTAKGLDATGNKILSYPGTDLFLDIHFVPTIILIKEVATASQGSDVRIPCVTQANPTTVTTKWTRGLSVLKGPRYAVLQEGSLLIRALKTSDAGSYTCTPSNKVGKGIAKSTKLVVKIVPRFTVVPPAIKTVRIGDDIHLECSAVSDISANVKVTWIRAGESLPPGRTTLNGGKLTIVKTRRSDDGQYMCLASATEGVAKHSTSITVLSTPGAPNITDVQISGSIVKIIWEPGHDGGYAQRFEVWYRKSSDPDYQWKGTGVLPIGTNSYTFQELNSAYVFSVRGINKEGAGIWSHVVDARTGTPLLDLPDKPLPPSNVIVNVSSTGYYLSWDYKEVPGRPLVDKFVVEYRENNTSNAWIRVEESVDGKERSRFLRAIFFDSYKVYEFRVYAFGNKLSEPAYASKTFIIAGPIVAPREAKNNTMTIVAAILGAVAFLVLLGLLSFCFVHFKAGKGAGNKSNKKVQFLLPDGKSREQSEITEDDYLDEEIKLRPETVRFTPDKNIGEGNHWRRKINKDEDFFLLSSVDHVFGGDKLDYSPHRSNLDTHVKSPNKDKVKFFGEGEHAGWYDCTLGRPASNEVRDSYDQFCRSPSEVGSRDSLDPNALKRALYEHQGSKMRLVKTFDGSNSSLQYDKGRPIRGPRYKPTQHSPSEDAALKRSKDNPHHWSLPTFYSNVTDWRNMANRDSDSDSVGSLGRRGRRRGMHRPSSYYEGSSTLQRELVPITEQDSDTNLRCSCEEDDIDQVSKAPNGLDRGSESSYLHLERNDSLKQSHLDALNKSEPPRLPYMDRLKAWDEESDGSVGKPYGPHPKLTDDEALQSIADSTSENSVSPAHSLASLTDSDIDGDIAQHINDALEGKRLSAGSGMLTGIPYTKHFDIDNASDISDKGDTRKKGMNGHLSLPNYLSPRNFPIINNSMHADSLDQLKLCDPYYQRKRGNQVSRTSSNASSGIYSTQVSSSETNSVDSPIVSRRHSKNSARSSATSSGFESSSSARESVGSEVPYAFDPSKAVAMRSLYKHRFPYLDEPYEWDREGTGSEFESGSEVGYKPNMMADMHQLLDLQQRLGIDLESCSSNESIASKTKLERLTIPEMINYSPDVPPSSFEVDNYSSEEKDKRCSKLMNEFKANRKVQDEKLNGSIIYQSWDL